MGWLSDVLDLFDLGEDDEKRARRERAAGWAIARDRARLLNEYDRREREGSLDDFKGTG